MFVIEREQLVELIGRGFTQREIAAELGWSHGTVRHWLRRYRLKTQHQRVGEEIPALVAARQQGLTDLQRECRRHGVTRFVRHTDGSFRCAKCRSEQVVNRRRKVKQILVAEFGGACAICGYQRCVQALQFHHLDPSEKEFGIAALGAARALERARAEAAKCVILCSNCHFEVENGITQLPINSVASALPHGAPSR